MTWIKAQAVRLWKWMCADWKRWLVLPAVFAGLAFVARVVRGALDPSTKDPVPPGTMTPKDGEDAIEAIDDKAEQDKAGVDSAAGDEKAEVDTWLDGN